MISPLHDLIKRVRHDFKLPDIIGERCVYALLETASCRACIEACPQDAWLLSDDSLGLDAEACDGCGLCAPACPQGAIINHDQAIAIRKWGGKLIALCACEYTEQASNEGVIPCINSVGLQDILHLQQRGIQQLLMATADCEQCKRGNKNRLSDRVASLNAALQKTHSAGIKLSCLPLDAWQRILSDEAVSPVGPRVDRRNFLRTLASTNLEYGMKQADSFMLGNAPFVPPGQLIPNPSSQTLWPYLPIMDAGRCNGCDACVKLCPQGAIVLDKADGGGCYRLDPMRCSGCSICVDVCEREAISIRQWLMQEQHELGLKDSRCTACGVLFHLPADHTLAEFLLCQICSENNHYKNLHQVLN
ncbi:MAG: 4Fe-4S binding protein [Arenicellales bacterium]